MESNDKRIEMLEQRVTALERDVYTLRSDMCNDIVALRQQQTANALDLASAVRALRSDVEALAKRFDAMERRIERLFAGAAAVSGLIVLVWTAVSPFLDKWFP